jgi:hypothetical protein
MLPLVLPTLFSAGSTMPLPGTGGAKTTKLLPVILTCIPYTLAAITSWIVAHSSQKRKELYIHTAVPAIVGGELRFCSCQQLHVSCVALRLLHQHADTTYSQDGQAVHMSRLDAASTWAHGCRLLHVVVTAGVFFVLFPFLSRVSMAAGFACLVLVAVSGACSIGPKTAIVHQISAGPSQVVAMPFYNR